jgi:hypothetical protein
MRYKIIIEMKQSSKRRSGSDRRTVRVFGFRAQSNGREEIEMVSVHDQGCRSREKGVEQGKNREEESPE